MLFVVRWWRYSLATLGIAVLALLAWSARGASVAEACAFDTLPQTYESHGYRADYPYLMDLAAYDALFPGDNEFGRQPLKQGPRGARGAGPGHIPPILLKSIGYIESAWQMGSSVIPYGGTGNSLAAGDCGYGIMQVTSGMTVPLGANGGASPVQALVATHYAYNIARGTAILANKWNEGGEFRPIAGAGDPNILEHWYFAVWGYNGFALVNHPLSERFQNPIRVPYSCTAGDSFGHDRSQYPYQELVYGCVARPPVREGSPLWAGQPAGLPNLLDERVKQALDLANFEFPYNKMDLYPPGSTPPSPPLPGGTGTPTPTPGPNPFGSTPSTQPLETRDTSAPPPLDRRAALIGAPGIEVTPSEISLTLATATASQEAVITLRNTGAGVGPWIAISSASWLTPLPGAGVAIGADVRCQTETSFCDRAPKVRIRLDLAALKPGQNVATLQIFSPQRPAAVHTVTVRALVTKPGQTEAVTRPLTAGCNSVGLGFPDGTAIDQVAVAVQPAESIVALWRLPAGGSWERYLPGRPDLSTLKTVNANEGLFICATGQATLTQTVASAGPPRPSALQPGCNFVAVAQDGAPAALAAAVQPAGAVQTVWRFDTSANRWAVFLPAAPSSGTLADLKRADGVFVCVTAAATLTQPGLAPG